MALPWKSTIFASGTSVYKKKKKNWSIYYLNGGFWPTSDKICLETERKGLS